MLMDVAVPSIATVTTPTMEFSTTWPVTVNRACQPLVTAVRLLVAWRPSVALRNAEESLRTEMSASYQATMDDLSRSEERRVGKECVGTCRYRWGRTL